MIRQLGSVEALGLAGPDLQRDESGGEPRRSDLCAGLCLSSARHAYTGLPSRRACLACPAAAHARPLGCSSRGSMCHGCVLT